MQIKTPRDGQEVRLHDGFYWISPQRDLVFALPTYIRQALTLMHEGDSRLARHYRALKGDQDIQKLAECLAQYVLNSRNPEERGEQPQDSYDASGLQDLDPYTLQVFGYCLFSVVMSAYWYGAEEGAARQPTPYLQQLKPLRGHADDGPAPWWVRGWMALRRLLRLPRPLLRVVMGPAPVHPPAEEGVTRGE